MRNQILIKFVPLVNRVGYGILHILVSTVLFQPIVHVTVTSEKKVFFFIHLKSKEKISAILGEFFPKIMNDWSKWYSTSRNLNLFSFSLCLTHHLGRFQLQKTCLFTVQRTKKFLG